VKLLLLATAIALTACASAEPGASTDAAVSIDGGLRIDASQVIADAPPPVDAMPQNTCAAAVTCATAQLLGTISGDTGAGLLTADGYQAAWFRVRVTEDYSDSPGLALRLASTLTLPSGGGFDTYVYVNAGSDVVECSTTTGTVSQTGNKKEVKAEWGEGFIPNGGDDSRTVTVEVRPTGTSCSAAQSWHLQIDGNWL